MARSVLHMGGLFGVGVCSNASANQLSVNAVLMVSLVISAFGSSELIC